MTRIARPVFARSFATSGAARVVSLKPSAALFAGAVACAGGFTAFAATAGPLEGKAGTNTERTFIAIKPDGVQRGIVGEIISRFEKKGFKLVAMKLIHPSKAMAEEHYADLKNKPFFPGLTTYFSSGPVIAMVWEGKGAIKTGRVMLGATNPADSAPGSIRGDLCIDVGRNICHGSDSPDSAQHEVTLVADDVQYLKPKCLCCGISYVFFLISF